MPNQAIEEIALKDRNSGLFCDGKPVALEGVRIEGQISGLSSQITVRQRYRNTEKIEIEAVYLFPLEEQAAVCGFVARLKDRVLRGEIDEKERAFERYDEAIREGNSAFLMEQVRADIFTISVGRIPPEETVEIEISYVAELAYEGSAIRLMLPTTVSPRYIPAHQAAESTETVAALDTPRQLRVPYGLSLELMLRLNGGLRHVESPSHPVRITLEDDHAVVSLSQREIAMDRDFVLLIEPRKPHQPFAQVACTADGQRFAMLHFRPDPEGAPILPSEVFFVLDCSGSMSGSSIEEARRALALCVRSLSEGDTFQIIRFGSSFERLWPEPVPFNQAHLDEASAYIARIDADLGGTEILEPLQSIYNLPSHPTRPRQIIVLTDGQVSNEDETIRLCRKGRPARVFAFGIGEGVSQHLVRGIARASGGSSEFIASGERIEPKVLRTFGRLNTPIFDKIDLRWGKTKADIAPKQLPPLFAGEGMTLFARIQDGYDSAVTLQADQQQWSLPLDFEKAERNSPIPILWARHAIRDLEESDDSGSQQRRIDTETKKREKILQLSKDFGLMSSVASYIAIEERPTDERSDEPVALRRVPIALTTGWGGHPLLARQAVAAAAPLNAMMLSMPASFSMSPKMASFGAPPPAPAPGGGGAASAGPAAHGVLGVLQGVRGGFGGVLADRETDTSREAIYDLPAKSDEMAKERSVLQHARSAPKKAKKSIAPPHDAKAFFAPAASSNKGGLGNEDFDDLADGFAIPSTESAREEAEPTAPTSIEERIMELLLTQRADGSFPESPTLRAWLGARWQAVQTRAQQQAHPMQIYTLAALALLRKEAHAHKSLWSRAEAKAQRWLDQQPQPANLDGIL